MKLPSTQFSLDFSYFLSLSSKYSEYHESVFRLACSTHYTRNIRNVIIFFYFRSFILFIFLRMHYVNIFSSSKYFQKVT
jgi:hypothetical protein